MPLKPGNNTDTSDSKLTVEENVAESGDTDGGYVRKCSNNSDDGSSSRLNTGLSPIATVEYIERPPYLYGFCPRDTGTLGGSPASSPLVTMEIDIIMEGIFTNHPNQTFHNSKMHKLLIAEKQSPSTRSAPSCRSSRIASSQYPPWPRPRASFIVWTSALSPPLI
ncbi:hypothetical protein OF83DRAFT_1085074 [Amylostereum chailletii]|nr:hypothetical protein OF83DRAFT_1085074 [Amylostereum chailletii]